MPQERSVPANRPASPDIWEKFSALIKGEMHVKLNFKNFHVPLSGKYV
jgi:hypothetical protein